MKLADFFDQVGLTKQNTRNEMVRAARIAAEPWVSENIHIGASPEKKASVAQQLLKWLVDVVEMDATAQRPDLRGKLSVDSIGREMANSPVDYIADVMNRIDMEMTRIFMMARIHGYFDAWEDESGGIGTSFCPICRRRFITEYGALSRRDNETVICNVCGDRQALENLQIEMGRSDKKDPMVYRPTKIPKMAIANTNQLRRLAGNSHRFALGYGLDFRLDTILDSSGLHLVKLEGYIPADQHPSGWAVFVTNLTIKVAFLTSEQPLDDLALSIRTRDYMSLEGQNKWLTSSDHWEGSTSELTLRPYDLVADEFTPDYANPDNQTRKPPAGITTYLPDAVRKEKSDPVWIPPGTVQPPRKGKR